MVMLVEVYRPNYSGSSTMARKWYYANFNFTQPVIGGLVMAAAMFLFGCPLPLKVHQNLNGFRM
jgi:hypothetical protein